MSKPNQESKWVRSLKVGAAIATILGLFAPVWLSERSDTSRPSTDGAHPPSVVQASQAVTVNISNGTEGTAHGRASVPQVTAPATDRRVLGATARQEVAARKALDEIHEAVELYTRGEMQRSLDRYESALTVLPEVFSRQLDRSLLRKAFTKTNRSPREIAEAAQQVRDLFAPIAAVLEEES